MPTVYYLTRSYLPTITGGTLIRAGSVRFLIEKGFNVNVFTPLYRNSELVRDNVTYFPFKGNMKFAHIMERMGLYDDYLDKWVQNAILFLQKRIQAEDIIFATTGGELGNIKLGSILKDLCGCKFVVNYHDPVDYTTVNGIVIDNKFHVKRDSIEYKYLKNADLIITSSEVLKQNLKDKYKELSNKVCCNYFGYIEKFDIKEMKKNDCTRTVFAYAGTFTENQAPEVIAEVFANIPNIELVFIGNYKEYKPIHKYLDKFIFIEQMDRIDFLNYMNQHVDVGIVSLTNEYLGACVPSKIFEYINLGLPILGILPQGDALQIINDKHYGIASHFQNISEIRSAIQELSNKMTLNKFKANVIRDRELWSMENQIEEVVQWLKNI